MKSRVLNMLCIGCLTLGFAACSDDDKSNDVVGPDGTSKDRVEDAAVQFLISQAMPGTYAADPNISTATADESDITEDLDVFVFDEDNIFEKHTTVSLTNNPAGSQKWVSDAFETSKGDKYFYVFANMPGQISTPGPGSIRSAFEKEVRTWTASNMTNPQKFYMGTLQAEKSNVVGGTKDAPQTISLEIGRLVAKVTVNNKDGNPDVNNLAGSFDFANGEYRLLNERNSFYTVAQTSNGFNVQGSQVYSPSYDSYVPGDFLPFTPQFDKLNSVNYTLENTNSIPLNQSGGSVEIKYVYTPADSEIFEADNSGDLGTLSDGTFWVGLYDDGTKKIFNNDPVGAVDDVKSAVKYTKGENYYVVPITDISEAPVASLKYAVLRNHYYDIKVNSISNLGNGDPGDIVDPTDPIDDKRIINVEITVLPWFLIQQGVDL